MTRAHLRAHWIGPPSPTGLWIGALLRVVAMLVSNVAMTIRMPLTLLSRECHTDVERDRLPEPESGPTLKETTEAAANSQTASQSQLTCAAIAAVDDDGGGGGGGDNALIFPPAESPTGPRSERGQPLRPN